MGRWGKGSRIIEIFNVNLDRGRWSVGGEATPQKNTEGRIRQECQKTNKGGCGLLYGQGAKRRPERVPGSFEGGAHDRKAGGGKERLLSAMHSRKGTNDTKKIQKRERREKEGNHFFDDLMVGKLWTEGSDRGGGSPKRGET